MTAGAVSTLTKSRISCQSAAMDIENRPESDTMPWSPHSGFDVMLSLSKHDVWSPFDKLRVTTLFFCKGKN
jgi:hypothetical protein